MRSGKSSRYWKVCWWFCIHRLWAIMTVSLITFSGTGICSQVFKLSPDKTVGDAGKRTGGQGLIGGLLQISRMSEVFRSTAYEMSTMSHPNNR